MNLRDSLALAILPLTVSLALADAPSTSQRPHPRPVSLALPLGIEAYRLRPKARPLGSGAVQLAAQQTAAVLVPPRDHPSVGLKGSVCNNPQIKGVVLKPITSRISGCGIMHPVQITSVSGVTLSPAAVINCDAAQALATWVVEGLQPAFNNSIVKLTVADSYSCRPRNNVRGAKVSEHGSGNAIDIATFVTRTGKTYAVAPNYGTMIRAAQKAGCGIFQTTLGPGSDGYHESHLHLDVARRRGSPYCH